MAACPYLSYNPITMNSTGQVSEGTSQFEVTQWTYSYGTLVQVECITTDCQIWDASNGQCGMRVSDSIKSPSNETSVLINLFEGVLGKLSERDDSNSMVTWIKEVIGEIADIDNIPSHIKGTCNYCNQPAKVIDMIQHVNQDHWDIGSGASMPYAAILMSEYQANEDMDSNSKVYGFDFKINIDDPEKPPMLMGMEDHPRFVEPPLIVDWIPLLTWYEGGIEPTYVANPDYTP